MDPADMQQALNSQGVLLGSHDQLIKALHQDRAEMAKAITELTRQVSCLTSSVPQSGASASGSSPPVREAHVCDPEPFHGDLDKCRGFLLQCRLVFEQRSLSFSSDSAKVNYFIGLLRGKALAWVEAMSSRTDLGSVVYKDLEDSFKSVFDHPNHSGNASTRLLTLRQGSRSVAEYSVDFWTLAADSGWNDTALEGVFLQGLSDQLRDELALRDRPRGLTALVSLAVTLDNRLRERRRDRAARTSASTSALPSALPTAFRRTPATAQSSLTSPSSAQPAEEEPMQLGRASLTPDERLRRIRAGECLYCGKSGHFISTCPVRPKDRARQ